MSRSLEKPRPSSGGRGSGRRRAASPVLVDMPVVVLSGAADAARLDAESVRKPLRLDTLLGLIDRVAHAAE